MNDYLNNVESMINDYNNFKNDTTDKQTFYDSIMNNTELSIDEKFMKLLDSNIDFSDINPEWGKLMNEIRNGKDGVIQIPNNEGKIIKVCIEPNSHRGGGGGGSSTPGAQNPGNGGNVSQNSNIGSTGGHGLFVYGGGGIAPEVTASVEIDMSWYDQGEIV